MNYTEIEKKERENVGHMFLYVEDGKLVAYELSAFMLKQLFPQLRLSFVMASEECRLRLLKIDMPFELALENTEYPLAVSDYYAEMTSATIPESVRSAWKRDFEVYKKKMFE